MCRAYVTLKCFPCCVKSNWHLHFWHSVKSHTEICYSTVPQSTQRFPQYHFHSFCRTFCCSDIFFYCLSFLTASLTNGGKVSLASRVFRYGSTLGCKEILIFSLSWESWNLWLDNLAAVGGGSIVTDYQKTSSWGMCTVQEGGRSLLEDQGNKQILRCHSVCPYYNDTEEISSEAYSLLCL